MIKRSLATMREAMSETYANRECEIATKKRILAEISRWERFTDDPDIWSIRTEDFRKYREKCLSAGFAARTIETGITAFASILRSNGITIDPGPRIRWSPPPPKMPRLSDFGKVFAVADRWGKAMLATSYFTALRTSDLNRLHRSMIGDDVIRIDSKKTGKVHTFPIHDVLRRWLQPMLDSGNGDGQESEREYPIKKSPKRLRESIQRFCEAAGVEYFTPQMIRRLSANQHEMAHPGSAGYLLGHSINAKNPTAYYLEGLSVLRRAQASLEIPEAMLPKSKVLRKKMEDRQVLESFGRLPEEDRKSILRMIRKMA